MDKKIYIPEYNHDVSQDYVALSIDNEYIPIQSLSRGYRYVVRDRKMFLYGLATDIEEAQRVKKIHLFCAQLDKKLVYWIYLDNELFKRKYYIKNGIVLWLRGEDYRLIPLMMLCVKKEYLFSINKNSPDPSQFCLVIDRKFINDEEHFKLYRNVKRLYIDPIEEWLDILYTNDIIERCFKTSSLQLPKFKNVAEMLNGLNSMNDVVIERIRKVEKYTPDTIT